MGRGTFTEDRDGLGCPPEGPGWVGGLSRRTGTCRETLSKVQDGLGNLSEVRDGSGDSFEDPGRVGDSPGDPGQVGKLSGRSWMGRGSL